MQQRKDDASTQYDLKALKQFNPALIYDFAPESSMKHESESFGSLAHIGGQFQDMYNAYLYAEQHILPVIAREGIKEISPQALLVWLDQIHFSMAHSLAQESQGKAGEYTTEYVFRWHEKDNAVAMTQQFIVYESLHDLNLEEFKKVFDLQVDVKTLRIYLSLLAEARDVVIAENSENECEPNQLIVLVYQQLVKLYHADKFSEIERSSLERIVQICLPPAEIPGKMQGFANNLIAAWQQCDPENLDEVVKLAQDAFLGVTTIHPYFNANGRTATCLMNIILLSLGYPSILLRYASEKSDPQSSYSQAIDKINTEPTILFEHIKARIQQVKENGPYENKLQMKILRHRLKFLQDLQQVKHAFPETNLEHFYTELIKDAKRNQNLIIEELIKNLKQKSIEPDATYFQQKFSLRILKLGELACLRKLKAPQQTQTSALSKMSVTKRIYSAADKLEILNKLQTLTGKSAWKSYNTNGLTLLLNLDDRDTALKLTQALNKTEALKATLMKSPQGESVIKVEAVHTEKLLKVVSLAMEIAPHEKEEVRVRGNKKAN